MIELTEQEHEHLQTVYGYARERIEEGNGQAWELGLYPLTQGLKGLKSLTNAPWEEAFPYFAAFFEDPDCIAQNYDPGEAEERFSELFPVIEKPYRFLKKDAFEKYMVEAAKTPPENARLSMDLYPNLPTVQKAVAVCFALSNLQDGEEFFFTGQQMTKALGLPPEKNIRVWRIVKRLQKDKVIKKMRSSEKGRATTYKILPPKN